MVGGLISEQRDFLQVQSYECLNGCVCNLLNLWGYPIKCSDVFFIGGGFEVEFLDKGDSFSIYSKAYNSNFDFLKKYEIKYHLKSDENMSGARQQLIDLVLRNTYIAVKVTSLVLNYNRVYSQTESSHYVIVCGYDEENDSFYIMDSYVPTMIPSSYSGWIDANIFVQGWEKTGYTYITLKKNSKLSSEVIKKDSLQAMRTALNNYCNPIIPNENMGEKAILALFDKIRKCEKDLMPGWTKEANYQLRVQGPISTRCFLMEKMRDFGDETLYNEMETCISKWNMICMMLLKTGISKNPKGLETVFLQGTELLKKEKNIMTQFLNQIEYKGEN